MNYDEMTAITKRFPKSPREKKSWWLRNTTMGWVKKMNEKNNDRRKTKRKKKQSERRSGQDKTRQDETRRDTRTTPTRDDR